MQNRKKHETIWAIIIISQLELILYAILCVLFFLVRFVERGSKKKRGILVVIARLYIFHPRQIVLIIQW